MSKSNLLKVVVVIGLSLLLVANLASVVLADDATYGWDDPTATTTQTDTTKNYKEHKKQNSHKTPSHQTIST